MDEGSKRDNFRRFQDKLQTLVTYPWFPRNILKIFPYFFRSSFKVTCGFDPKNGAKPSTGTPCGPILNMFRESCTNNYFDVSAHNLDF